MAYNLKFIKMKANITLKSISDKYCVKPNYFYQTAQEMNGKYGWFDSTYKSYNLTEYYSGYSFASQELLNEFKNIN